MKQFEIKFYREWYDALSELSREDRAAAALALLEYVYDGVVPEDQYIRIVTVLMRNRIDRDKARSLKTSTRKTVKANATTPAARAAEDNTAEATVADSHPEGINPESQPANSSSSQDKTSSPGSSSKNNTTSQSGTAEECSVAESPDDGSSKPVTTPVDAQSSDSSPAVTKSLSTRYGLDIPDSELTSFLGI